MNSINKRTPNPEQSIAIFHSGGKLLSAGAGSGKTFVLVEHIIYLLDNFRLNIPKHEYGTKLKSFLRSKVLMTFTKKAAGEMSVRVLKKIEEIIADALAEQEPNQYEFWVQVRENLNDLNITTIHGFCHKILRQGYWQELPLEIELLKPIEQKNKINRLFDQWYEINSKHIDSLFLSNADALMETMFQVFSSPELRLMWRSPHKFQNADQVIDLYFKEYLSQSLTRMLFESGNEYTIAEKYKSKKWAEMLLQFSSLKSEVGVLGAGNFERYEHFFGQFARFPSPGKEMSEIETEVLELLKEFRADLNKISDDFLKLKEHFQIFSKWSDLIFEVFSYIDDHYLEIPGFTFSDLEFYVLVGLRDSEICKKICEAFDYFIVDEFQDTSSVQYEILQRLIGHDTKKLFAVGDRKQAIYGFRGGELSVFEQCSKYVGVENNNILKNNYRSSSQVIQFNNELFEKVFPLGQGYFGHDPHSVKMEAQEIPETTSSSGEVASLKFQLDEVQTASLKLDSVESQVLVQKIKQLLLDNEVNSICVLYRKLIPSKYLLEALMEDDIAFTAQVKIQIDDDPVANIFLLLVETQLNHLNVEKYNSTLFLLNNLLKLLRVGCEDIEVQIKVFREDLKNFGLKTSFLRFLYSLGLTNSFHSFNTELIESICDITKENLTLIYEVIKQENESEYSFDMMKGSLEKDGKRIIIMSAHASKGLEFDAVFLAGIHTNGRYMGMRELVGKLPASFKWKAHLGQRQFYKSPFYFLESQLLAQKDFSESKRLLYVACTRAVKRLYYVDLAGYEKGELTNLFENKNSWIQALRLHSTVSTDCQIQLRPTEEKEISLLHKDPMGLVYYRDLPKLGVTSELSVTRLATIAQCPFKFYLQNICRIDPSDSFLDSDQDDEEKKFYSSMKRGSQLHATLSELFERKISLDQISIKDKKMLEWVVSLANNYVADFEVISEKMIKFSLFGQMISGTPDLVFQRKFSDLVIWDFKTGNRNTESEQGYWFQLMCYAYAYANLNRFPQDHKIEFSLIYLDECCEIKRELTLNEITQELYTNWKKVESLHRISPEHCPHCSFNQICQRRQFPA